MTTTIEQAAARSLRETRCLQACEGLSDEEVGRIPALLAYLRKKMEGEHWSPGTDQLHPTNKQLADAAKRSLARRALAILSGGKG